MASVVHQPPQVADEHSLEVGAALDAHAVGTATGNKAQLSTAEETELSRRLAQLRS